jgi:hypothetical protein
MYQESDRQRLLPKWSPLWEPNNEIVNNKYYRMIVK